MTITSKKFKTIISLLAVVIMLSSIITIPAHADFIQRSKAFIAAALAAINIVTTSAEMDTASLIEYIADPLEVNYSYVDAWQDRPEIQIYPDYTVIDGREYTDIWLSNEAAEKFRVDAWDFKTAYSIASNTNGTFVSGEGYFNGLPVFLVNNYPQTQYNTIPNYGTYSVGNGEFIATNQSDNYNSARYYIDNVAKVVKNSMYKTQSAFPWNVYFKKVNSAWGCYIDTPNHTYTPDNALNQYYVADPFDLDYVASTIPANESLPQDTGMMIRVPSDDGNGNRYFDTWLHDNPEFDQGEPVIVDVTLDPTIQTKLDDLLDILIPIMPIINNNIGDITFATNHSEPVPPQDTLLSDTWWSTLDNKLDQIRQTIQNLTPDFGSIIQAINNIPNYFSQITSPITQAISNLSDQILRDIEEGPIRLLDKLINVLRTIFFPILATLRSFLGIWHYVVTWMSNISAPFTWIMGIMSGTSAILVSPIYAFIAGIIVISVYRRFGR